jgi:radical SAM protein (TIGR01212 family)
LPHYLSYRSYLKKRFGTSVLKIPLNAGFSCPNRDGTISSDGCSFCDNRSFSPVAITTASIVDQLRFAMERDRRRHEAFIAYLQPFSNTYGTQKHLEEIYEPIIACPGVVGLAIGTRPDCFEKDVFDYLETVSKRTYLSVEIGLQSGSDATLTFNRRGHDVAAFTNAVHELSGRGIETVAHVMIGLPPDAFAADAIATAKLLSSLPVTGIKIHQLMIIRDTLMQQWYEKGEVAALPIETYADILCDFLSHVRPDQHIHRIMADSTEKCGLIAPLWSSIEEKTKSIAYIHGVMDKKNLMQGENYNVKTPSHHWLES